MGLKKVLTGALALSLSISIISSCNENSTKEKAEAKTNNSTKSSICLPANKINKEDIKKKLSIFGSGFEVVKVENSPINNLYKVVIKSGDKYAVVYMDCKLNYALIGSMVELSSKRDLTRETVAEYQLKSQQKKLDELKKILGNDKFEELKKVLGPNIAQLLIVNLTNVPKEGVIIYGDPKAKYTVYIISDPQCPFCAKLHQSIKEVLAKEKDVKFEITLFPLPFHQYAEGIAENIASQTDMAKRKELLDKSFEAVSNRNVGDLEKLNKANEKGAKILEAHKKFAKSVNLRGTPMIIFPVGNNKAVAIGGAIPTDMLIKIIDVLKK